MSVPSVSPVVQKRRINVLRVTFLLLLPLLLFTRSGWEDRWPVVHDVTEALGALLVIAGVLGRFWSILYSGGRKNQVVVQDGPYSMCRHPLYLFSTTAVVGFGLLTGSIIVTLLLGGLTFAILYMTSRMEENYLIDRFGQKYVDYAARVPAIIPNPSLFRTPDEIVFVVRTLKTNFRDALVFLAFLPLAELLEVLHESAIIPSIAVF
jgi:protein-S-isoprenylcysteine O-methyltransferase Ste14